MSPPLGDATITTPSSDARFGFSAPPDTVGEATLGSGDVRKTNTGTTLMEFDHQDELVGPVTLELEVDWVLTPGLPASRTEPAEGPDLEIRGIHLSGVNRPIPCPDDVHDAFVAHPAAVGRLLDLAVERINERAEMAADDAAHAAMEPDI